MLARSIVTSALLFAVLLSTAAPANGATEPKRPRLRSDATVTGDVVRIGDLIANAGIVANVPIFRAPDLGATGTVSADAVLEAVREHALVGLDPGDIREVMVTRASRTIAPKEVEDSVVAALSMQFSLGPPQDLAVTFENDVRPVYVEPSIIGQPRVARVSYDSNSGRFDAVVAIPTRRPLHVSGRATPMIEVATVTHEVARGDVLKQADVVMERRPRRGTMRDALTERAAAVGLAARNGLQPGQPLRPADLMKPELVRRHEMVMLIYQVPGITLTVHGRANEGGAQGDIIGVLNEQTKRVVHGVVIDSGRVMIGSDTMQLATNGGFGASR